MQNYERRGVAPSEGWPLNNGRMYCTVWFGHGGAAFCNNLAMTHNRHPRVRNTQYKPLYTNMGQYHVTFNIKYLYSPFDDAVTPDK